MSATKNPELVARRILEAVEAKEAPIKLRPVAEYLDVELRQEPLDSDLSGILVKKGQKVVIGYNSKHTKTRQRFTVAHEMGHYVLDHPGEMFFDKTLTQRAIVIKRDGRSSEGTDRHEVEANRFAAELLMPRQLVEKEVTKRLGKSKPVSAESLVKDLASLFEVSSQAMEFRLINLGFLIPE